ncbi:MAG TPA: M13-type metalloendopeptidase [Intrasporangium sp.]|uniref:M13 family metallopeptidase n=1 Tax=Intrasporangium sp. TaxID=1925024 RepID=UPI002B469CAB|nr:M13-type metalloendopeptidase [Intrasporangium sp.]HKX67617.1 M13-type metalloendopeptidase [Intrasporangium sp.]
MTQPSGLDLTHLDRTVRPQDDLFRFVNGRWLDTTEIPADRARFGTFDLLREQSTARVHELIEQAAADHDATAGSPKRQVGDLFASFMDTERVEELGLMPLQALLGEVAAVDSVDALVATLGRLYRVGVTGVLALYVSPDQRSPEDYAVYLEQAGLGLPDESYYREDTYADIRVAYVTHLERLLGLAGIPEAADKAARVMALETRLALHHWDQVANRDAVKTYNAFTLAEAEALAPEFPWHTWLSAMQAPEGAIDKVVVRQPSFVTGLGRVLGEMPLEDWQAWLTFHVVSTFAGLLPEALVDEDFDFHGRTLSGQPEIKERWKRGVAVVESAVGEAVGQLYAERWFPPEAKDRMQHLVANLVEAFRRSFASLEWMGEETRKEALRKLDMFVAKIGYPEVWRDYSSIEIDAMDLVGNVCRATKFEVDRNFAKLGKPIDRTEWFMLPQTVNAYYMPSMNEIVFPAAILQPPFFDPEADDAANYGGIGAVIGHEIGHGFDDQGSRYDGTGALRDWWTEADRERFDALAQRLIEQFNGYTPAGLDPKYKVNGALTVGENIGDLGGLQIGYAAYRIATEESGMPDIDGFTGPQRFFLGWAQVWRGKAREAEAIRLLAVDPHSPLDLRANAVRNVSEFHEAFGVEPADGMWLPAEERVGIF